jgi:FtsZ-binding cell division protein ZapB
VWQQELEPGSSSINAALEGNRILLRRLHESKDKNLQLQNELASLHERMDGLEDENLKLSVLLKESQEANPKRDAELAEGLSKLVSKLHINKGDLNE